MIPAWPSSPLTLSFTHARSSSLFLGHHVALFFLRTCYSAFFFFRCFVLCVRFVKLDHLILSQKRVGAAEAVLILVLDRQHCRKYVQPVWFLLIIHLQLCVMTGEKKMKISAAKLAPQRTQEATAAGKKSIPFTAQPAFSMSV